MPAADLQLRACLDAPFIILGQRLHPLRLGHLEMLHRWNLTVITTPAELVQAILICCHWPKEIERLSRRWSLRVFIWLWQLRFQKWDFHEKRALFEGYINYHLSAPEVHNNPRAGQESAIPFHQRIRAILCSRLGYDPERVGDVTMQRALWDYYAWAEFERQLTVLPATSDEIEESMARLNFEEILARMNQTKSNGR